MCFISANALATPPRQARSELALNEMHEQELEQLRQELEQMFSKLQQAESRNTHLTSKVRHRVGEWSICLPACTSVVPRRPCPACGCSRQSLIDTCPRSIISKP